jgi:hypothetical protein
LRGREPVLCLTHSGNSVTNPPTLNATKMPMIIEAESKAMATVNTR